MFIIFTAINGPIYSLIILMLYLCTIKLLIKVQDCSGENCSDVRPNKSQTQPSI